MTLVNCSSRRLNSVNRRPVVQPSRELVLCVSGSRSRVESRTSLQIGRRPGKAGPCWGKEREKNNSQPWFVKEQVEMNWLIFDVRYRIVNSRPRLLTPPHYQHFRPTCFFMEGAVLCTVVGLSVPGHQRLGASSILPLLSAVITKNVPGHRQMSPWKAKS